MKCPNPAHKGMGPELRPSGWGEVLYCFICREYYTSSGCVVLEEDLPKHNPGHEVETIGGLNEDEWQDLWEGGAGF